MTEQSTAISTDTPAATVEKFLYAMHDKDLDTAAALLDDNVIYQNVGFSTIRGARGTMKVLAGLQRPSVGFDVKFHRVATEGDTVLTERTDALMVGRVRLNFWVCGVFEVHDGRITLWRDYFDALDFTKAFVRGLAGAVRPGLQRKF
jgi:limonene-1,2-epoxide hydrolase